MNGPGREAAADVYDARTVRVCACVHTYTHNNKQHAETMHIITIAIVE